MRKYYTLIHKFFLIKEFIQQDDLAFLLQTIFIQTRFHKIITIPNPTILKRLIKYVTLVTRFHHIEFNDKPYYETENMWESYNIKERPKYDINVKCQGYIKCEPARKPTIIPGKNDKIKYMLKYNYSKNNILIDDVDYDYFILSSQIYLFKLKNVLLIGFDKLTIINSCGINADHRGSDHCNVFLPMHNKIKKKKYVTLYDLAIIYYKLKSHKWDSCYEMFCYSNVTMCNKDIAVSLIFDHGS